MRRISTALAAFALLASGCTTIVLDPLGGETSTSSTTGSSSSGSGGSGGAGEKSALALRGSDFAPGSIAWDAQSDYAPWGGNPDWLVLVLASGSTSCTSPAYLPGCDGPARWQTILSIPPELNTPGLVDLQDPRIFAHELIVDFKPGCGNALGAGNGFSGTLDIQQSDDTSMTLSLANSGGSGHPPANGDWVAHRCGPAPAAPPTPAVAFRGSNLPPGGPSNPDPDKLYVVVGTGGTSCANPFTNTACNGSSRILFSLPPALQKPGKIDLFDPAIAATYTISALDGSAVCHDDAGSFSAGGPTPNGYLEIQSIDSQQISVRVYKSYTFSEHNLTFAADGHYTASICP